MLTVGSALGAVVLAGLALYGRRLPAAPRPNRAPAHRGRPAFQSGIVNDYVTWIVIGLACIGGTLAFAIR